MSFPSRMWTFTTMLTEQKIPLGQYIAAFVEWLTQHGANYFDAMRIDTGNDDPRRDVRAAPGSIRWH